ncbi:hypothetical protein WA026_003512 [Henosepilachna vigintioctopunctata]|uniref:Uncharacterized protein n=1 Tax=Henosepilachna vigintioctopunctata TaxID=420089 RepID=A0AAW1TPV8_9CUCU
MWKRTVVFVVAAIFLCLLVDVESSPVIKDQVDVLHSGNLDKYTHFRNHPISGFDGFGITDRIYWKNQHKKFYLPANYYGPHYYRQGIEYDYAD